jgi:hypothetical protein
MERRSQLAFALVILAQAMHSVEEYVFRLYDVFAPARWVSGLFSADAAVGFAIGNAAIVLFGIWCYWFRVRSNHPGASGYAWFWACLELANGAGHLLFTALRGAYFPGVGTAPLLIASSCYLGATLAATAPSRPGEPRP